MTYKLVQDGKVIHTSDDNLSGMIEVEIDADPTQPLGWAKSAAVHLDPEFDRITIDVVLSGGGQREYALRIRRVTRPGRDRPQLLLTLPEGGERLASGDHVIG